MVLLKSVQKNFLHFIKLSLVCAANVSSLAHNSIDYCSTLCGLLDTHVQTSGSIHEQIHGIPLQ
ncbi:hypothetical protein [Fluviispira sanaruensis]|uniref:Uncharacterized protein n=1 Tax=Fluviispira sanaruensis TaxID=2493639 RepID=A0A4P2VWA2_FLUSA|nr:hypothetical protein [Fluviispira sanaruensis]BBH53875.1 hypothetical protein JCM31447_23280 [Fluviispira sanaruensis]